MTFRTVADAREYVERHDEWEGFLQCKTLAGLRAQATVTLSEHQREDMLPLIDQLGKDELVQVIAGASFPKLTEAIKFITGNSSTGKRQGGDRDETR
jgi:hypothetical protein